VTAVNTTEKESQFLKVLLTSFLKLSSSFEGKQRSKHLAWSSGVAKIHGQVQKISGYGNEFLVKMGCHAWGLEVSNLKQGLLYLFDLL
jgi:hypothetical protein